MLKKLLSRFKLRLLTEDDIENIRMKTAVEAENRILEFRKVKKDSVSTVVNTLYDYYHGTDMGNLSEAYERSISPESFVFWQNKGWFNFSKNDLNKMGAIQESDGTWRTTSSGANNRNQSESTLQKIQNAAYVKYHTDSLVNSTVENYKNYVIGVGVEYSIPNQTIYDYITEFWNDNIKIKQRNFIHSMVIDGEYFWLLTRTKLNKLVVTKLYPSEILSLVKAKDNRERIQGFNVRWSTSDGKQENKFIKNVLDSSFDFRKDTYGILFTNWNEGDEDRGVVPIETALRPGRWAEDFIIDRVILNHERSRVIWIKKILGANSSFKTMGDAYPKSDRAPAAGVMLTEGPNEEYKAMAANINASDVTDDYKSILYQFATAVRIPMDILTQRVDEQVYASIKKSANSFHQTILTWRVRTAETFLSLMKVVVKFGIETKQIPDSIQIPRLFIEMGKGLDEISPEKVIRYAKTKKSIDTIEILNYISFTFPNVFTENEVDDTRSLDIQREAGVLSLDTMAAMLGRDYTNELVKIIQNKEIIKYLNDDSENKQNLNKGNNNDGNAES